MMQVIIQTETNDVFNLHPATTINDVKQQIFNRFGHVMEDQVLMNSGRILENELTLSQLNIKNLDYISVFSKLLGGKVHGSLARAGKVRNQTKKVAKKEKKRPKCGRCKLRQKFNRRIRAAEAPSFGGRRKGPNSNAGK